VVVTSDDFEGIESSDIYGNYEGSFKIQFNEADWIEAYYTYSTRGINRNANAEAVAIELNNMMEYCTLSIKSEIQNRQRNLSSLPGGPKAKFIISRTAGMETMYKTSGINFIVTNFSTHSYIPSELTPRVVNDGNNVVTNLKTSSSSFTATIIPDDFVSYIVTGKISGTTLSGDWKAIANGKVIYSATYSARKISD